MLYFVRHTLCICAIKLSDRCLCILGGFVCNVCDTFRAASTIICQRELQDRANTVEEVLFALVLLSTQSSLHFLHPNHPPSNHSEYSQLEVCLRLPRRCWRLAIDKFGHQISLTIAVPGSIFVRHELVGVRLEYHERRSINMLGRSILSLSNLS